MPTTTGCLTNHTEAAWLDHLARKTSYTFPTTYLGLLIATPTDAGGTEVTVAGTNGYARQACGTGGGSIWTAAASRSTTTNADVTWGPSTGGPWTDVAFVGLYDAATAGNLLAYGDSVNGAIGTDDSYRVLSGTCTLTATAGTKWTDAVLNAMLDHTTGRTTYGAATDTWLALYYGDPLVAGVEATPAGTNGYARVALDDIMAAAVAGSITNSGIASYGPATADWNSGTAFDYFAVMSAVTAGTLRGGAALTTPKTVLNGGSASFAASALVFTLD